MQVSTQATRVLDESVARLVFILCKFSHITPLLPVEATTRIRFKTLIIVYKAINGLALTYQMVLNYTPITHSLESLAWLDWTQFSRR